MRLLRQVWGGGDRRAAIEAGECKPGQPNVMPPFGLVCLHACGDLVPNMLMAFAGDEHYCRYLFAVSCCYMKVSCTGARPVEQGSAPADDIVKYPMSRFIASLCSSSPSEGGKEAPPLHLPDTPMGYHLREQACHAIGTHATPPLPLSPSLRQTHAGVTRCWCTSTFCDSIERAL